MRILLLAAALVLAAGAEASPRVRSISVLEPRAFGYFAGDIVRRQVVLRLAPGVELEAGTLPQPGPLNYWLELKSGDVAARREGDGTLYRLSLEYQTFYSPLDPHKLTIPQFKLKVSDKQGSEDVSVPAWSFLASPLRPLFLDNDEAASSATTLMPDAPPRLLPTGQERTVLLAAAVSGLAALILLARHRAWWPFHNRRDRPFTEAARFLRSNTAHLAGAGGYRAALLKLHRAFDLAAGRRVLSDDLDAFLREHPEFAPFAADIGRLFACSRRAFYGDDLSGARSAMPLPAIAALSLRLGNAERAA